MDRRRLLLELSQNLLNSSNTTVDNTSVLGDQGIWVSGGFEGVPFLAFLALQDQPAKDEPVEEAE